MALAAPLYFANAPTWVWHWLFWIGIIIMALMVIDAGILLWGGMLRLGPVILANIGLLLLASAAIWQSSYPSKIPSEAKTKVKCPTLFSLFMTDLQPPQGVVWQASTDFEIESGSHKASIRVSYNIMDDFNANAKYMSFYIPSIYVKDTEPSTQTFAILESIASTYQQYIKDVQEKRWAVLRTVGSVNSDSTKNVPFSGRIFLYHADDLSIEQLAALQKLYRDHGATAQFRGIDYSLTVWNSIQLGAVKPQPKYEVKEEFRSLFLINQSRQNPEKINRRSENVRIL
ncbi:MAG: hypothetical protein ACLP4V_31975 [Methylocella sp.]